MPGLQIKHCSENNTWTHCVRGGGLSNTPRERLPDSNRPRSSLSDKCAVIAFGRRRFFCSSRLLRGASCLKVELCELASLRGIRDWICVLPEHMSAKTQHVNQNAAMSRLRTKRPHLP